MVSFEKCDYRSERPKYSASLLIYLSDADPCVWLICWGFLVLMGHRFLEWSGFCSTMIGFAYLNYLIKNRYFFLVRFGYLFTVKNIYWYLWYKFFMLMVLGGILFCSLHIRFGYQDKSYVLPNQNNVEKMDLVEWLPSDAMTFENKQSFAIRLSDAKMVQMDIWGRFDEQSICDHAIVLASDPDNFGTNLTDLRDLPSFREVEFNSKETIFDDHSIDLRENSVNELERRITKKINDVLLASGFKVESLRIRYLNFFDHQP